MSTASAKKTTPLFDVARVRRDFPILGQKIHGRPLVYLDNAATSQKPVAVLDAIRHYYEYDNANVHRGVHTLSERATAAYEDARVKIAGFLGSADAREVVYVRGTTEAINLVAFSYAEPRLRAGDEVLITEMEHHSNIVPWQLVCERTGASLKVAPIDDHGELEFDRFTEMLSGRTKFVAVGHVSNALGTVNPVRRLSDAAHAVGAPILVDGAQSSPRMAVDVGELDCDFFAFSGHKTYGPTGIGALWGRAELLDAMRPYQGGGEMILSVSFEKTVYNEIPHKFEAGTPNIAGAVGLGAAIDYLEDLGMDAIEAHEAEVLAYADERLRGIEGLRMIGEASCKAGVHSFVIDGVHPHDIGTILDHEGIAIRSGHHCAQPVMQRFGVPATVRASLGLFNTREEIDRLVDGLIKVRELFG